MGKEYWEWFRKINCSPLAELFMGQLRSSLTCSECKKTYVTFDPFWDLQLPFPKVCEALPLINAYNLNKRTTHVFSARACFDVCCV